jgi:threonine dehydratase
LIPLEEIRKAREVIAGAAVRTPLIRLEAPESDAEIYLKLENLQPIRSFKIRGATNAVRQAPREEIERGVLTASAGNMAQGVAWAARDAGVPCAVVVPEHAPQAKVDAIERLGGRVIKVPYERWWQALVESRFEGEEGLFVHPVENDRVMAGNGTIGLELLEELPDLDAVLIPFGGGGLTVGIASAVKALRPEAKVYPVEPETAAPLAASLEAGEPQEVEYMPSFVDGAGARTVLEKMWPLVQEVVDGSCTASLEKTAAAVSLLAERASIVAEGAGALGVAAALAGRPGTGKIVCIVSGGNIDSSVLAGILTDAPNARKEGRTRTT